MASPVLEIIVDDRQLRKLYKQYPIQIDNAFKRILSDGSIIVQKELRDTAPVGVTQNLARNVQRTVSKYQARIRPLASYTYWVENGRSAGKMPPWPDPNQQPTTSNAMRSSTSRRNALPSAVTLRPA